MFLINEEDLISVSGGASTDGIEIEVSGGGGVDRPKPVPTPESK